MKKTKITVIIISFFVAIFTFSISAFAHPGSLDDSGGHYDRSTGEYHYHHGHPAHQHDNGECPYDFEDDTEESYPNSDSDKETEYKTTNTIKSTTKNKYVEKKKEPLVLGNKVPIYIVTFIYIIFIAILIFLIIKTNSDIGAVLFIYFVLFAILHFLEFFSEIFVVSNWIMFLVPLVTIDIFIFTIFLDEIKNKN